MTRREIYDRFINIGAPKRSLNRWLVKLFEKKTLNRKKGSGRIAKKATPEVRKAIKRTFNHKAGRSQRKSGKFFSMHYTYVSKILKKYSDIRVYKKYKKPKMTLLQRRQLRPKCKKILEKYRGYNFIIDDEKYFTLSNTTLAGNDRFYSDNIQKTPESVKNKYQSKYETKVLVWMAISPLGISKPYFRNSGMAVNRFVYRDEILEPYLLPFIKKYHKHDKYVFWPDQASAHYAKEVQEWLVSKKVEYLAKKINPANAPKLRPIEDFWGILSAKVYEKDWSANNLTQLKKKISKCMLEMDLELVQEIAASTQARLDTCRRHGYDAL